MPDQDVPILLTKFHLPRPAPDAIARPRLSALLTRALECPLTLVSAPAGFGKSTLLSQWVAELPEEWRCGWFSIDPSENEFRQFLLYLVSSTRKAVPESFQETMEFVRCESPPSPGDLAVTFCSELDSIDENVVLIPDDFHRISDAVVLEFLIAVLKHPPANLHLVIATRRDPALSLNRWRAKGQIKEIRLDEMRFSTAEVQEFLARVFGVKPHGKLVKLACGLIDGWPVAMRMLALSLQGDTDPEILAEKLPALQVRPFQESTYASITHPHEKDSRTAFRNRTAVPEGIGRGPGVRSLGSARVWRDLPSAPVAGNVLAG